MVLIRNNLVTTIRNNPITRPINVKWRLPCDVARITVFIKDLIAYLKITDTLPAIRCWDRCFNIQRFSTPRRHEDHESF